jgi:hypothetical protein
MFLRRAVYRRGASSKITGTLFGRMRHRSLGGSNLDRDEFRVAGQAPRLCPGRLIGPAAETATMRRAARLARPQPRQYEMPKAPCEVRQSASRVGSRGSALNTAAMAIWKPCKPSRPNQRPGFPEPDFRRSARSLRLPWGTATAWPNGYVPSVLGRLLARAIEACRPVSCTHCRACGRLMPRPSAGPGLFSLEVGAARISRWTFRPTRLAGRSPPS